MATEETFAAIARHREAEAAHQRTGQEVERTRRDRDAALERQRRLEYELQQVERSLNITSVGQTSFGGVKQERFPTSGGRESLLARRKELRAILNARPAQVAVLGRVP